MNCFVLLSQQRWTTHHFSEESRFRLHRNDGKVLFYLRRYEHYADCCVLEHGLFGHGRSFMVWAEVVHHHRSPPVVINGNANAQLYRYDILALHIIPPFHNNANISIFSIMPHLIQLEAL